ncbi:hypothetical protein LZ3411_1783 [Levilactobacillus zymae]|uniref:Uncharacterized protein n=1 Tax=Levilactobacillus zymae TaxID=267363 RepID=A0A1Y6K156_9LACO|nr:hypothetical protein LZ3411_1783 [Levilactobacillus zymae]
MVLEITKRFLGPIFNYWNLETYVPNSGYFERESVQPA